MVKCFGPQNIERKYITVQAQRRAIAPTPHVQIVRHIILHDWAKCKSVARNKCASESYTNHLGWSQ